MTYPITNTTSTRGRTVAAGPLVRGISRAGGECYDSGLGIDWHAAHIREYDPRLGEHQARLLCAGSILMSDGRVYGLRRLRMSKRGGYSYTFDPMTRHWTRSGTLAGPAARLP